jgi:hypothetical protein
METEHKTNRDRNERNERETYYLLQSDQWRKIREIEKETWREDVNCSCVGGKDKAYGKEIAKDLFVT